MAESRRKEFFPEVTDEQWNDWKWQVKNRIETVDQLKKYLDLDPSEEEGDRKSTRLNSSHSRASRMPSSA